MTSYFVTKNLSKSLWASKTLKNSDGANDILLKYTLLNEFLNDLDAQSDFDKKLSQKNWSSRTILILLKVCSSYHFFFAFLEILDSF